MNRIIGLGFCLVVIASCKKNYTCTCDDKKSLVQEAKYQTIITANSTSKAKDNCKTIENLTDQNGNALNLYSNCNVSN